MSDPQPVDDELARMTTNPTIAEAVKAGLRRLAKGEAGPEMAEMAKDVLAGRTSLREIGRSSAYGAYFTTAVAKFQKWESELSPAERSEFKRKAREQFGDTDADA